MFNKLYNAELEKAETALSKEKNLEQISFYEGYIKGLKFINPALIEISNGFERRLEQAQHDFTFNTPMGVSQWRNHGVKYHYFDFFEKQAEKHFIEDVIDSRPKSESILELAFWNAFIKNLRDKGYSI